MNKDEFEYLTPEEWKVVKRLCLYVGDAPRGVTGVMALVHALNSARAECDQMGARFSRVLTYTTGNRMSKTNYAMEAMYSVIDDYITSVVEENAKEVQAELDTALTKIKELEAEPQNLSKEVEEQLLRQLREAVYGYMDAHAASILKKAEEYDVMQAKAEADAARWQEALEAVEWVCLGEWEGDYWTAYNGCPWCGEGQHNGHAPDCQRQSALAAGEKNEEE